MVLPAIKEDLAEALRDSGIRAHLLYPLLPLFANLHTAPPSPPGEERGERGAVGEEQGRGRERGSERGRGREGVREKE